MPARPWIASRSRASSALLALLAVALLVPPSLATAANPDKGATYSGKSSKDHRPITLRVSKDGTAAQLTYTCLRGRSAGTKKGATSVAVRIAAGRFQSRAVTSRARSIRTSGAFSAGGKASGKVAQRGCTRHTESFSLSDPASPPPPPATLPKPTPPVAVPLPPPAAAAGEIVFRCRPNLCAVDPDGTNRRQLTSDGAAGAEYGSAALSRDGRRMVFQGKDGNPYAADRDAANARRLQNDNRAAAPQIRADGSQVLWTFASSFPTFFATETESFDGTNHASVIVGDSLAGFAGASQYICATQNPNEIDLGDHVGVHDSTGPGDPADPCRRVAYQPVAHSAFGWRPQVSPDGALVVDSFYRNGFSSEGIYLFDTATGAVVSQLTTGEDDDPVFSPDGRTILFDRVRKPSSDVYAIPTTGGVPALLIADATSPSWGG